MSFGASSLGGVFHPVAEDDAVAAVHAALDCGINYFDVAPAYGTTRAETVLGKALKGIARDRYVLSMLRQRTLGSSTLLRLVADY